MAEQDDYVGAFLRSTIDNSTRKDSAAYLQRGRPYAGLATEQVADLWVSGLKAWLSGRATADMGQFCDAGAELHLRGIAPPFEAARTELEMARSQLSNDEEEALRNAGRRFAKSLNETPN